VFGLLKEIVDGRVGKINEVFGLPKEIPDHR
jgi:hypothetical protein